jgi:hypothetical protein
MPRTAKDLYPQAAHRRQTEPRSSAVATRPWAMQYEIVSVTHRSVDLPRRSEPVVEYEFRIALSDNLDPATVVAELFPQERLQGLVEIRFDSRHPQTVDVIVNDGDALISSFITASRIGQEVGPVATSMAATILRARHRSRFYRLRAEDDTQGNNRRSWH